MRHPGAFLSAVALVALLVVAAPPGAMGQMPDRPAGGARVSGASGFVVAPGWLVTTGHAVDGCMRLTARNPRGHRVPARLVAQDGTRDLALLAVPGTFAPPLPFRRAPPAGKGDRVVAYAATPPGARSASPVPSHGEITAENPLIYTASAPPMPFGAGGPLLDGQGNVAGIVTARLPGPNGPPTDTLALRAEEVLAFLADNSVVPHPAGHLPPQPPRASVAAVQCYH